MAVSDEQFAQWINETYHRTQQVAFGIYGIEDAEEATQLAYMQVWQMRHKFRGNEKGCFVAIVRKQLGWARHRINNPGERKQLPITQTEGWTDVACDYSRTEGSEISMGKIQKAIGCLSDSLRDTAALYYLKEHTTDEIAAILDCSPDYTRVRLVRARAKLQEALSG